MANRDPLGIGFEPASHKLLPPFSARFRSRGRACCALLSITAQLFPRGPLTEFGGPQMSVDARAERAAVYGLVPMMALLGVSFPDAVQRLLSPLSALAGTH